MGRWILALTVLFSSHASAAVFHSINTARPLECTFSWRHHNRIAVEQGRIKKVISPEGKLYLRLEEESGQLFVGATSGQMDDTTISVITETGLVQDLQIHFTDRPSEIVMLRYPTPPEAPTSSPNRDDCQVQSISTLIDAILSGRVPGGFECCQLRKQSKRLGNGIILSPRIQFDGPSLSLVLFEVKNRASKSQGITEREIAQPGCQWVYLEDHQLNPKTRTFAIVAFNRA